MKLDVPDTYLFMRRSKRHFVALLYTNNELLSPEIVKVNLSYSIIVTHSPYRLTANVHSPEEGPRYDVDSQYGFLISWATEHVSASGNRQKPHSFFR